MTWSREQWFKVVGSTASVFSAATAAGKAFGANQEEMLSTLGIAGVYAPVSAIRKYICPDCHPMRDVKQAWAWLCMTGVFAAESAKKGLRMVQKGNILDGPSGFWVVAGADGKPVGVALGIVGGVSAGLRFEGMSHEVKLAGRVKDTPPGACDPHPRIKDMNSDGVYGDVIYPSVGLSLFHVEDKALSSAIFAAYNDWLAEFCKPHPDRLHGIGMVLLDDVEEGIAEMKRVAQLGLAGVMISVYPIQGQRYDSPRYEPFWVAAQDLDMPISLHVNTNRSTADIGDPQTQGGTSKL